MKVLQPFPWEESVSGTDRVEVQPTAEEVDGGHEMIPVYVAAGLTLDVHDFAV